MRDWILRIWRLPADQFTTGLHDIALLVGLACIPLLVFILVMAHKERRVARARRPPSLPL